MDHGRHGEKFNMLIDFVNKKFKYILYRTGGDHLPLIVVLHGSGEIGSSAY